MTAVRYSDARVRRDAAVDEDRAVRLASVDVNDRRRLDPEQIIASLAHLVSR